MPPKRHMPSNSTHGHARIRRATQKSATCKTCSTCRQKKIKCSGVRPHCDECRANNLECIYPRDARREPRPSRALLQNLEATMSAMLHHVRSSGQSTPALEDALRSTAQAIEYESAGDGRAHHEQAPATPESPFAVPLPTPASTITASDTIGFARAQSPELLRYHMSGPQSQGNMAVPVYPDYTQQDDGILPQDFVRHPVSQPGSRPESPEVLPQPSSKKASTHVTVSRFAKHELLECFMSMVVCHRSTDSLES